jgi:hypothetical protein
MPYSIPEPETAGLAVTIFNNAITSIQLALEDFSAANEARLLSAVRNLHAGVLLLYKSKLSELSPPGSDDALVKKYVVPKRLHPGDLIMRHTRILGSQQNGREYLYEALQIATSGKVKVMAEIYSLDEITKAYERVAEGKSAISRSDRTFDDRSCRKLG